jgi:N-acetyltransferase
MVQPDVLEGRFVRLEPAERRHAESLAVHAHPDLFHHFLATIPQAQTEEALASYIEELRGLPNTLTFAVVLRSTGGAVGCSSYMDIRPEHLGLEIGMTWYGKEHQGTRVNPESKLLMMEHAFERLGCERVQLKTDGRNLQSQRAIEKLGAVKEGVLRRHGQMPDGHMRDTVMYSILPGEWPDVRRRLEERLR